MSATALEAKTFNNRLVLEQCRMAAVRDLAAVHSAHFDGRLAIFERLLTVNFEIKLTYVASAYLVPVHKKRRQTNRKNECSSGIIPLPA
jgi:hypothetical protein